MLPMKHIIFCLLLVSTALFGTQQSNSYLSYLPQDSVLRSECQNNLSQYQEHCSVINTMIKSIVRAPSCSHITDRMDLIKLLKPQIEKHVASVVGNEIAANESQQFFDTVLYSIPNERCGFDSQAEWLFKELFRSK